MAMICVSGGRECDGCMACKASNAVGICEGCGMRIYEFEDYYDINGELVHEECLLDWAAQYVVGNKH